MRTVKYLAVGLVVLVSLLTSAGRAQAEQCGATTIATLYAGQTIVAGTVNVYNDANNIYVQYLLNSPWVMSDAHVAVASTLDGIPQTKAGNPIPGRFPYSAVFDPELMNYTFVVPIASLPVGGTLIVAAHAIVHAPKSYGGTQTGWADGQDFPGANWATYIAARVNRCGAIE